MIRTEKKFQVIIKTQQKKQIMCLRSVIFCSIQQKIKLVLPLQIIDKCKINKRTQTNSK